MGMAKRTLPLPIGYTNGRWTVLGPTGSVVKSGAHKYECRCACGTHQILSQHRLTSGKKLSCGCIGRENARIRRRFQKRQARRSRRLKLAPRYGFVGPKMPEGYNQARSSAGRRELEFMLTPYEYSMLREAPCHYCTRPGPGGIDREDSELGYVSGNSVPCCQQCNYGKNTLRGDEWLSWLHETATRLGYVNPRLATGP